MHTKRRTHTHEQKLYRSQSVTYIQNRDHRRRSSFRSNNNEVTSGHVEFQVPVIHWKEMFGSYVW